MVENHPEDTRVAAYIETPQTDEFKDVRQHLLKCSACRKRVEAINTTIHNLKRFPINTPKPTGEHPDEMVIADYVEKRLSNENYEKINQHISGCSFCTKAALHYALENIETQKTEQQIDEPTTVSPNFQKDKKETSEPDKLHKILFFRMPVWMGGALAVAASLILFFVLPGRKDAFRMVSYQDRPEVVFRSSKGKLPGIGFFGESRERSEPYSGVEVYAEDKRHLRIKWSEIKNARLYDVRLYSINNKGRTQIGQATTSGETEVLLQISAIIPGKRYEWEISGKTADNINFITRGGFVVGVEVKF